MSLILEALRKSESERRQGAAPDLLQPELVAAPATARRLPRWAWLAPWLLALPLLWWWQRDTSPAHPDGTAAQAAAPTQPIPASTRRAPSLPPVERLQPPPTPPVPVSSPSHAPATAAVSASPAPAPASPAAATGPIALGALAPSERKALPPLQLSMHLWNEDPARRVAILDGRRIAVGDRVGPAVVAGIQPDGVLLDWNGKQVLVPLR